MQGCLVVALVVFLLPFALCSGVTHDGSVMLIPLVLLSPFILLGLLSAFVAKKKDPARDDKAESFADTVPDKPLAHRKLEARLRAFAGEPPTGSEDTDDARP